MYSPEQEKLLGLSKEDCRILEIISKTPYLLADITKRASLPRSTVEYRLNILKKRNMVDYIRSGKRKLWKAIDAKEVLLQVKGKSPSPSQVYMGKREIISLWYKITSQPRNTRLTVVQPHRSLELALQKLPRKDAIEISRQVKEKAFIVDTISHQKSAEILTAAYGKSSAAKELVGAFMGRLEDQVKVPDDFLDESAEMNLFTDTIVLIDWDKEVAIEIRNRALYKLLVALFERVKAYGTRYYLGKNVEELARERKILPTPPGKPR